MGWSKPSNLPGEGAPPLPIRALNADLATFTVDTDAASAQEIRAAVRHWEESNGCVAARVFRTARPIVEEDLSVALLQSLRLECLQGAGARDIRASRIPPHQAVNILFSATAAGGVYGPSLLGAYGRLAAWRSLGGLVGATAGASIESIAGLAHRCLWASFDASSEWSYDVAWDHGLLAIRPDGLSFAVLAATDTD